MNYTDEQFDKLPKWAKSHIELLEMRNRELQEDIDDLLSLPESNTQYDANYEHQYNLPDRANIRFILPSGVIYARITERGQLGIYCGMGSIHILPQQSNTCNIIVEKR